MWSWMSLDMIARDRLGLIDGSLLRYSSTVPSHDQVQGIRSSRRKVCY